MPSELTAVRRKRANEARLNAIREKAKHTETRQLQIKNALQSLDGSEKKSTHIQFSDSDDSDQHHNHDTEQKIPAKPSADDVLGLGESDENEDINIAVKPQFQGKDGEKLLELQSSYGNDARFQLDERFADNKSDDTSSEEEKSDQPSHEDNNEMKGELERNMQLLNQVIGHDVTSKDQTKKKGEKFIDVSSLRYDPTKDGHLEIKETRQEKESPKKKKRKKEKQNIIETDSKKFFQTSNDALRNAFSAAPDEVKNGSLSLKEDPKPFSFLAMLGRRQEDADESSENAGPYNEEEDITDSRFSLSSMMKKDIPTLEKQFAYDSSDTEEEDEKEIGEQIEENKALSRKDEFRPHFSSENENWPTTFFLTSPRDPRIVAGVKNFCWNKPFEQIQREWLQVKDTLIKDYKKKHRDAKRRERRAKYEAKQLAVMKDT